MDFLYELRDRLQEVYAEHSRIFDKGLQFIVALLAFYLINRNLGFMEILANPVITFALAVICTFFPWNVTVLGAGLLILAHMYAVSLGVLSVTFLVFLVMFIFYFRLTPKMGVVVLLTPVAFLLKIPFVIPIACGLLSGPISMVAVSCGTMVYYMIDYVKNAAASLAVEESSELMGQVSTYLKAIFQDRELWIYIIAFMLCVLLVYTIHRMSVAQAWKIAIAAGTVANIVVIAIGSVTLGISTSYGSLILGSLLAILVGLILELLFFSVDYARSENLQYEDDEYYYYVKAVPKLSVSHGERKVTRIHENEETQILDTDRVQRRSGRHSSRDDRVRDKREAMDEVDRELISRNLREDIGQPDDEQ